MRPTFGVAAGGRALFPCVVPKSRSFARYWLPVLVWMGVIFSASSDSLSFQHSSRLIGPVVRWLFPHLSDEAVHAIVVIARKCAHLAEYAVLTLLLWRALRKPPEPDAPRWRWSEAGMALALVALVGADNQ